MQVSVVEKIIKKKRGQTNMFVQLEIYIICHTCNINKCMTFYLHAGSALYIDLFRTIEEEKKVTVVVVVVCCCSCSLFLLYLLLPSLSLLLLLLVVAVAVAAAVTAIAGKL